MRQYARTGLIVAAAVAVWASVTGAATLSQPSPDPNNAYLWCGDMMAQTCAVPKRRSNRATLDAELSRKYWDTLPPSVTWSTFNAMARSAIGEAESRVFAITGLDPRQDVKQAVFERSKAIIVAHLRRDSGFSAQQIQAAVQEIEKIDLILTSDDYVAAYVARAQAARSSVTEAELRVQAYREYQAVCGRSGLDPNASFDKASDKLLLCPGLFLGVHDYGPSKQDMLDALAFTAGHEIGHAIDADAFPGGYARMGACYREITGVHAVWAPGMADEISADHWGAVVLAEFLRTRAGGPPRPEQVRNIIAYATDGLCDPDEDPNDHPHAPPQFRINQTISRNPVMVGLLHCPVAGPQNPTCTMRGKIPATAAP